MLWNCRPSSSNDSAVDNLFQGALNEQPLGSGCVSTHACGCRASWELVRGGVLCSWGPRIRQDFVRACTAHVCILMYASAPPESLRGLCLSGAVARPRICRALAREARWSGASVLAEHAYARRWRATCVPSARRGRLRTHARNRGLCGCALCVVARVRALQSGKRHSARSGQPAVAFHSVPERRF